MRALIAGPRFHTVGPWVALATLAANSVGAAEPVRWTLENGLKACVVEDRGADAASIGIAVRANADCEPANKAGLRAVLQHVIRAAWDKQIESDEKLAFLLDMDDVGAGLSINTDWEYVGFGYSGTSDTLDDALAFMPKAVFEPEITEEVHKAAVELVRSAILGTQTGPADSTIALFRAALLDSPGRTYPLGTLETIDNISVADLVAFHRRYYVASLTGVCVIAPLPADELRADVERQFGDLPPGKPTLPPPPGESESSDSKVASNADLLVGGPDQLGIASVVVGVPAPGCWDPDLPVAYVVHALLGGNGAATGRIEDDDELWDSLGLPFPLEEAKKNKFIQSIPPPLSLQSHLAVHAYASPRRVEDVREALLGKFQELAAETPSPEELQRAKDYVRNAYAVLFDMHPTRALLMSRSVLLDLPHPLAPEFTRQVDKVTPGDVRRVARSYFSRHAVGVEFPEAQE